MTKVARRLGHSVAVLLKVYANCVEGEEQTMNGCIEAAVGCEEGRGTLGAAAAQVTDQDRGDGSECGRICSVGGLA